MSQPLKLALGDPHYSSWSMRAGLIVLHWELPVEMEFAPLRTGEFKKMMVPYFPARTVPALRLSDQKSIWDSLAIAETLAELYPEQDLWPRNSIRRAEARCYVSEMHSSYQALRRECPMNLRVAYQNTQISEDAQQDVARIDSLWGRVLAEGGPWLFGEYSIADVFLLQSRCVFSAMICL